MRILISLIAVLTCTVSAFSQNSSLTNFQLTIHFPFKVSFDSIEIGLIHPPFSQLLYKKAAIKDGKARFIGTVSHPSMAFLYSPTSRTQPFIIEPGAHEWVIDSPFRSAITSIVTANNKQLANYLTNIVNPILDYYEKLLQENATAAPSKKDTLIQALTQSYQNGLINKVVFKWLGYLLLGNYGYHSQMATVIEQLSNEDKNDPIILLLKKRLESTKERFVIQHLNNLNKVIAGPPFKDATVVNKKYILYKFWFYKCYPCRQDFEQMAANKTKLAQLDLSIICVQSDIDSMFMHGDVLLIKTGLPITNYHDKENRLTKLLEITKFPTSFLLNTWNQTIIRNPDLDTIMQLQ
jgi:hypothetical protein